MLQLGAGLFVLSFEQIHFWQEVVTQRWVRPRFPDPGGGESGEVLRIAAPADGSRKQSACMQFK